MSEGVEVVFNSVRELSGGGPWVVRTDDGEHEAKAVVIATGLSAGGLGVPDEEGFEGRGLSHCASCDGPLFAGQHVVVTGDDRWLLKHAAEFAQVAAQVTLVGEYPMPQAASAQPERPR